MDVKTLQEQGGIYFEQIRTGFSEYNSECKKRNRQEAYEELLALWKNSFPNEAYVDFYYYQLEEEEQKKAASLLTDAELNYLRKKEPALIFPLEEMLLEIVVKLNEAEMLFSTVYFTGEPGKRSTWWGNYGQEYIVFTDRHNVREEGIGPVNQKR